MEGVIAMRERRVPDLAALDGLLREYDSDSSNLIAILQQTQEIYGYLPEEALYRIASATGCPAAAVFGVSTFYSQFRMTPVGKYLILLCKGTACYVGGADPIEAAIRNYLDIPQGGTTKDGLFTLEGVACIGCCCLAPAMMVNGRTYGHLTPNYALSVLRELRAKEESA